MARWMASCFHGVHQHSRIHPLWRRLREGERGDSEEVENYVCESEWADRHEGGSTTMEESEKRKKKEKEID